MNRRELVPGNANDATRIRRIRKICVTLCRLSLSALRFSWRHWRPDVESEMEEKILVAVWGHPELYDATSSTSSILVSLCNF